MLSETWVGLTSPEHHSIYKTCIMYIYIIISSEPENVFLNISGAFEETLGLGRV